MRSSVLFPSRNLYISHVAFEPSKGFRFQKQPMTAVITVGQSFCVCIRVQLRDQKCFCPEVLSCGMRQGKRLTSLSPFFFLVWTDRDSTSLSNWSTCMFRVSMVFYTERRKQVTLNSGLCPNSLSKIKAQTLERTWHSGQTSCSSHTCIMWGILPWATVLFPPSLSELDLLSEPNPDLL